MSGEGDLSGDGSREHWERVWTRSDPDRVSWHEVRPDISLRLIGSAGLGLGNGIIDVGGGASCLARELLSAGYEDVSVLEISNRGIEEGRRRLAGDADSVHWIRADVRRFEPGRTWDLWHDRAVFHFLTLPADRSAYRRSLDRALAPDGQLVLATFGPDGPAECSGLEVCRYDAQSLSNEIGPEFTLVESHLELHTRPAGGEQQFLYALFRRT